MKEEVGKKGGGRNKRLPCRASGAALRDMSKGNARRRESIALKRSRERSSEAPVMRLNKLDFQSRPLVHGRRTAADFTPAELQPPSPIPSSATTIAVNVREAASSPTAEREKTCLLPRHALPPPTARRLRKAVPIFLDKRHAEPPLCVSQGRRFNAVFIEIEKKTRTLIFFLALFPILLKLGRSDVHAFRQYLLQFPSWRGVNRSMCRNGAL